MANIYLDNAASSWPKPESVYRAVDKYQREIGASPGRGGYKKALEAKQIIEDTRRGLQSLFNITDQSRIAYTSNATEAINICLKGLLNPGDHVIISSMEHNSTVRPIWALKEMGIEVSIWHGYNAFDVEQIKPLIKKNTRLISTLHASNVNGDILPAKEIGRIAKEYGLLFMLDTAQTAGVLPVDIKELNTDILIFTGHKGLMGPQGTGGFYLCPELELRTWCEGGTGSLSESFEHPKLMPNKFECGTGNTLGIAGLGAGIKYIKDIGMDKIYQDEQGLYDVLLSGLREIDNIKIYGNLEKNKSLSTLSFNIKGLDCGIVSHILDDVYDISTRAGLQCAPLAHQELGTFPTGTCRLSPAYFNTFEEMESTVKAIYEIARMYA